ncbi:MAG: SUMF1/EgtB/PvdO family nonheme iron enzyme [Okeania sp. SIO3I5]|uniref:SUMF1/EgtB/PvdO family nonheme iron enzyme n=1 Tax=Okeania sp. SIO3I5 TaxID=2607805 RepID=UPI0013B8226B|nr:SUMF1/EgtB/PvdO family nonheme iron enzyme [Okeania sp. SIO3I5]NEQ35482.1 SUMF1/EgtB/PvdO family nonheme iron enzyme [Okeania sp. SIO3I5]
MGNLEESIVLITSASDNSRKADVIGTGFAFYQQDNYTYLLTCAHVVEDVGGKENVLVNNIPAKVLAIGDVKGFDLAVLGVEKLNVPLFQLISLSETKNRKFQTAGHFLYGEEKKILLETVGGTLGKKRLARQNDERVAVWNLLVDEGDVAAARLRQRLRKGYSGAPVVDLETGYVLGVATNMEKDGTEGLAISVEALKKIWSGMPPAVSQQIIRESLETSDNLSVEEVIALKQLDIPNNSPAQEITQPFDVIKVNSKGEEIERRSHEAVFFTEDLGNGVRLEMVYIPGGTFIMGSPENEEGRYGNESESPQHEVTLEAFYMSKYPITQNQYQAIRLLQKRFSNLYPPVAKLEFLERFIIRKNPSHFKGGNRPVECVSWYDAVEFCQKLSQKTGKRYKLPSESQWEYACRAGTTTPFYFGETITSELVNYNGNFTYGNAPKGKYPGETSDVGSFPPNAFGLYDMHGNVWEWCLDIWHNNYEDAPTDGSAWESERESNIRLLRGGSWNDISRYCRCAGRNYNFAGNLNYYWGFRVVLPVSRS